VSTAATGEPVTTMGGLRITPAITLDKLDPAHSELLILPGSEGWETGAHDGFVAAASRFLDAGKAVAAICGATSRALACKGG
jgi:putative intracellular protease/amidase